MLNMTFRDAVTALAGVKLPGDTQERWLERAATRTGLSFRTIKSLFYGETSDPPTSVSRALEQAMAMGGLATKGARHELALLEGRLAEVERRLAQMDAMGVGSRNDVHGQGVRMAGAAVRSGR